MVFIWTNIYSQGYSYVKNGAISLNGDHLDIIKIKIEDIGVIRNDKSFKKFLVDYFFYVVQMIRCWFLVVG